MKIKLRRGAVVLGLLSALNFLALTVFAQGSLTPPGAPAPTMKTLSQIEPRTPISSLPYSISTPGAYYLTTNLTGISGSDGIDILASNVDLDLNGFTMTGVAGSSDAIFAFGPGPGVTIRNGTVTEWGNYGILVANASDGSVQRVRAIGNTAGGISIGVGSMAEDCTASGNGAAGITAAANCRIKDCVLVLNSTSGLSGNTGAVVSGCTVLSNSSGGIGVGNNSTVTDCTTSDNTGDGIDLGNGCSAIGCVAGGNLNTGKGIFAGNNCTVKDCTASGNPGLNGAGIYVGNNCTVSACNASGNTGGNAPGIWVGLGCTVSACTAGGNGEWGIYAANNSTVTACTASSNLNFGIQVQTNCTVEGCTTSANGNTGVSVANKCLVKDCTASANASYGFELLNNSTVEGCTGIGNQDGIYVSGVQNRIDNNNVGNNSAYGIYPLSTNVINSITRNSAPGNGAGGYFNYPNNPDYAPIGTPGTSTNPWQNFQ